MLRWNRDKDRDKPARTGTDDAAAKLLSRSQARAVRPAAEQSPVDVPATPATLESVLLSEGTVTAEAIKAAQEIQAREGGFLGQILINLGYIDANSLTSFLAKHCKIPHLSLLDYLIDEEQVKLVPQEICLKYRLLPIDRLGKNLTVAMVNPLDTAALDEVRKVCPDLRVKPILCEYSHFQAVAARLFKQEVAAREMSMSSLGLRVRDGEVVEPAAAPAAPAAPPPAAPPATPPAAQPQTPPPPPMPPAPAEPTMAALEPLGDPEPPQAPPEPTPAPEPAFDDEAVLEAFFALEPHAPPEPGERSTVIKANSVLQEMVAIMGDSMRDTYGMLARKLDLFHGLTSEQVAKIFAKGVTAEYDEGQTVFHQGDNGADLYVILGGAVAITQDGVELARLTAGDAFGEMALHAQQPRTATVHVLETSSFLVLNEQTIRRTLDKDTALQLLANLVVNLSRRLRQAGTSAGK